MHSLECIVFQSASCGKNCIFEISFICKRKKIKPRLLSDYVVGYQLFIRHHLKIDR